MAKKKKRFNATVCQDGYELEMLVRFSCDKFLDWDWRIKCTLWWLGVATGGRISELIALPLEDIHPNYVTFRNTKNGEDRSPSIFPEMRWWLQAEKARREKLDQYWLFPSNRSGQHIKRAQASVWWSDVSKAAGVRDLGPHAGGRSTYLTTADKYLQLQQKNSRTALMRLAGHKDYRTTARYVRPKAGEEFEELVFPKWLALAGVLGMKTSPKWCSGLQTGHWLPEYQEMMKEYTDIDGQNYGHLRVVK